MVKSKQQSFIFRKCLNWKKTKSLFSCGLVQSDFHVMKNESNVFKYSKTPLSEKAEGVDGQVNTAFQTLKSGTKTGWWHIFNPSPQEAESGRSQGVPGQPGQHHKPCLREGKVTPRILKSFSQVCLQYTWSFSSESEIQASSTHKVYDYFHE